MRRMVDRLEPPTPTDVPGRARSCRSTGSPNRSCGGRSRRARVPTLARWVRGGTHQITGWECDLSSQTGASQAGILHGNNDNMPAFRWYDKDLGKVLTSNRPAGCGRSSSTASPTATACSSTAACHGRTCSPATATTRSSRSARSPTAQAQQAHDELRAVRPVRGQPPAGADRRRRRARDRSTGATPAALKIEPRLKRGGIYPVLRAATTTILRDLTLYTLMSDVYRGVPAAYADFVGYDEVAHHSGIFASTALDTLGRLDQQLGRLEHAIGEAPRPYHVVVLSDHGQTPGSDVPPALRRDARAGRCRRSSTNTTTSRCPQMVSEGWGNLNGALTEVVNDKDSRIGKLVGAARAQPHRRRRRGARARLRRRGQVALRPSRTIRPMSSCSRRATSG